MNRPLSFLFLALLVGGACFSARAEPWPMIDHDAAHTAFGEDLLPLPLVLMWTARLPAGTQGTGFALDQGAICVLGNANASSDPYGGVVALFAYDSLLGRPLLSLPVGTGRAGAPAVSNGAILVAVFDGAGGGFLNSYPLDGEKAIRHSAFQIGTLRGPPAAPPSPLISGDLAWLPGAAGNLSRWDSATLSILPSLPVGTQGPGEASPVDLDVSDSGVDAIGARNDVTGQAADGAFWHLSLEGNYPSAPAVIGPYLFLPVVGVSADVPTKLYTIDPTSGQVRWSISLTSPAGIAADRNRVYAADVSGTVQAFDEATGAVLWTWASGFASSGMIIAGGRIVVGDASGMLHALDSATGVETWSFPTGAGSARRDVKLHLLSAGGPDAVGDSGTFLYALREDGILLAFRNGRYGDLNGDGAVGVDDALIALRSVIGLAALTPGQAASADVAPSPGTDRPLGNGVVDLHDVLSILRKAVGLDPASWPFSP